MPVVNAGDGPSRDAVGFGRRFLAVPAGEPDTGGHTERDDLRTGAWRVEEPLRPLYRSIYARVKNADAAAFATYDSRYRDYLNGPGPHLHPSDWVAVVNEAKARKVTFAQVMYERYGWTPPPPEPERIPSPSDPYEAAALHNARVEAERAALLAAADAAEPATDGSGRPKAPGVVSRATSRVTGALRAVLSASESEGRPNRPGNSPEARRRYRAQRAVADGKYQSVEEALAKMGRRVR